MKSNMKKLLEEASERARLADANPFWDTVKLNREMDRIHKRDFYSGEWSSATTTATTGQAVAEYISREALERSIFGLKRPPDPSIDLFIDEKTLSESNRVSADIPSGDHSDLGSW